MENTPPEYTGTSEYAFGAAELAPYIWGGFAVLTLLGAIGIVLSFRRRHLAVRRPRGTAPDDGDTILHTSMGSSQSWGAGHASRIWRVTKDPQQYAKAFVPGRKR
ncbi:hypothetical protein E2K80_05940 [Rhodophyticola sp. CCM32]|uniref:hypothetical protein n=1 Tax=Rhodophyticola sp. CCM32 TaxID=2916397 RepID=UPI00107F323A|nr:hypothetical protein [Rhodophyticola sp. CCM32]QBY00336.1 hypothetical protein E2K80_05940 [Rhodophyticola sp. CCM32]